MSRLLDDPRLDWPLLRAYGFDADRYAEEARAIAEGRLTEGAAILTEPIAPAPAVTSVGDPATDPVARDMRALGEEALRAGRVAAVVLNGGMATRFGNVVKGVVEVDAGRSFLALKAEDAVRAARRFGRPVPLVLMNSFATDEATRAHVEAHDRFGLPSEDLLVFQQSISIRLDPLKKEAPFIGADGKPSYYAPGHGDFYSGIRGSGVLAKLRARGIDTILFSNVDNLGATIDPTVLGYHLASGAEMSAEVTAKRRTASGAWDKGGAPALVGGRLRLVEGFRFPKDLPEDLLPDFSTNNFLFRAEGIDRELPLARHLVKKSVDGKPAVQLESIACEASEVLSLEILRVPREGPLGRFFPVKERIDLDAMRDALRVRLAEGWRLRDSG